MAQQIQRYGHAAFTFAVQRGGVAMNPFAELPPLPDVRSTARERVLSDAELRAIWLAAGDDRSGRIVRMLILTGQRREEVAGLRWDELVNDLTTWTLPGARAKNGRAHVVPLSAPEVIGGALRHGDFVFNLRSPFAGHSKGRRPSTRRAASPAGGCTTLAAPWRQACNGSACAWRGMRRVYT